MESNKMSLSEANLFHLRHVLKNFPSKKSAFVDNHRNCVQILCLVGDKNEILVRYRYYGEHKPSKYGRKLSEDEDPAIQRSTSVPINKETDAINTADKWKLIVWFQNAGKIIQDLCFDPNGRHLLVVCYDNTLHIVPILWIIDPEFGLKTTTSQEIENFYWLFRCDEITSFIVPFSGPHECSNSKTCPNNSNQQRIQESAVIDQDSFIDQEDKYTPAQINELVLSNHYQSFFMPNNTVKRNSTINANVEQMHASSDRNSSECISVTEKSPDGCEKSNFEFGTSNTTATNTTTAECPFPQSVVWWNTSKLNEQNPQHRAIIGYSDNSICVVGLAPNCPFIANTSIENKTGGIAKMFICRDSIFNNVSLLITLVSGEQWKLLLEQHKIGYIFPDELRRLPKDGDDQSADQSSETSSLSKSKFAEQDWQFVIPVSDSGKPIDEPEMEGSEEGIRDDLLQITTYQDDPNEMQAQSSANNNGGIFPAARARLASLRDLGAKKIGALKLKLIENKIKSNERDQNRRNITQLATMYMPSALPEVLSTTNGPFFTPQFLRDVYLLSALHSYSNTVSVHSMDIGLVPLYLYKIPKDCSNVLVTPNIMYTMQTITETDTQTEQNDEKAGATENHENVKKKFVNAIGVIGCNLTTLRIGEDSEYDMSSMLGIFPFRNETIIDVHRVPNTQNDAIPFNVVNNGSDANDENPVLIGTINTNDRPMIHQPKISTKNYVQIYKQDKPSTSKNNHTEENTEDFFDANDKSVVEHVFPALEYEQCLVITNQSVYLIELKNAAHILFLNLVRSGEWKACEEFCKIFNLDYMQCIEYAGDVLLRKNEVTQSLLTYNVAKIPPVKTALKLAMFGQNNALMHLCAMALKIVYVLRSAQPKNHTIKYVDPSGGMARRRLSHSKKSKNELNCGIPCSDFSYENDETPADLQMSNSSQFHLSNLLLLTLTEKAIKDKQLMPLWNFLIVNKRYHTNMSSIVLAQSGLYSSTVVLALNRGAHLDALVALCGVTNQEFGWYSEINDILYQLSDPIFMECITYLKSVSMDYFDCIQNKCDKINQNVLERLCYQLDPFHPIYRPVVSQLSSNFIESDTNDLNKRLIEFCKHLIETFLIVIIKLYVNKNIKDEITNGLNVIYVQNEQNQFAIRIENGSNISAGFGHCAAIVDGCCYLWGSSGVNCALSATTFSLSSDSNSQTTPKCLEFISNMGLEVHAVKCGKAHTLILTNNGLYAMGSNLHQQLGIGKHQIQALQPMLIKEFDGKNISLIEAGQYHNAVYADGELYTWGWGVYGQLGHGDIFTMERPKLVRFFKNKPIKQIALGHAHSLILCGSKSNPNDMILYSFGCNLFGQLGTGQYHDDSNQKWLKSCFPIRIDIGDEIILQIHTKFFTNFVITKSNRLYTWGASPQLIRLLNQSKKRARLAQKFEETKTAITNELEKRSGSPSKDRNEEKASNFDAKDSNLKRSESSKNIETASSNDENDKLKGNLEERIKNFLRAKTTTKSVDDSGIGTSRQPNPIPNDDLYIDEEYTDHFLPMKVNTDDVSGVIVQVSSGLYHNALVTNLSQLYTWGRNLEKQLGRENTRCDIQKPTHLEQNDNVIYVECGADFTLILTDQYAVKAFGNNNMGQCGRDINTSTEKGAFTPKLVRLRVSKRIVRLPDASQCIEKAIDVPLPRPKIRMNFDAVRYLKSIPKYRPEYISREIFRAPNFAESPSSENFDYCNISPRSPAQINDTVAPLIDKFATINLSPSSSIANKSFNTTNTEMSSEFIHYCLFILHGIYDPHKILKFTPLNEFKVRILMLNYYVKEAFELCLSAAKETIAMHQSQEDIDLDNIMLTSYVIKLFEYFTKDANIVPIHRTDLKYLIHAIFTYFIEHSLSMQPLEIYFLNNIDHYLFGLAFVLFFNNNNTKLERKVQQKYSHLFSGCATNETALNFCTNNGSNSLNTADDEESTVTDQSSHIEQNNEPSLDFEMIFKCVSTSFKTIICQRLIEFDSELN